MISPDMRRLDELPTALTKSGLLTPCRDRLIVLAMLIVRTILAALVAFSIAIVPATGGVAVSIKKSVDMSMSDNADAPCCPCCNGQNNSKHSVGCALKCLNFVAAVLPAMIVTKMYLVDAAPPSIVVEALRGYTSSPPTHPPPV